MKRGRFFRILGSAIIIAWLVMIGILVKKTSFTGQGMDSGSSSSEKISANISEQQWMEIFLKGKKVGYSVRSVSAHGEDFLIWENIFLKLNLMSQASGIHTSTQAIVDKGFLLKSFRFRIESGVVVFQISGEVEGKSINLEIGQGKANRTETIELESPPVIASGIAQFFRGKTLEIGQSFKFPVFDPSTLAQEEMEIRVAAREKLIIKRIDYDSFRLEAKIWGRPMRFWVDNDGSVLKEEGFMGLSMVRSNAATATENIEEGGTREFYEIAAINVNRKFRNPERISNLVLKIGGLEEAKFNTSLLNEGRQRYSGGKIEIIREKIPPKGGYSVPFKNPDETYRPFMSRSLLIQSDDRAIVKKAREILGGIDDPVLATRKIVMWVYNNLRKIPVITVPSAVDVLKTRMGDCNEHAVLVAALLRASGIPAKICAGLVYSRGKFYYHAWNESYIGLWTSVDATLNQMPADATHIKLVEGGPERQVEIIKLINNLTLDVVSYRRD